MRRHGHLQGADRLRVTSQTELHQTEVVPGNGQHRPAAACRPQTLQRSTETALRGRRRSQGSCDAVGGGKRLPGVVAAPGPIKNEAEELQGNGGIGHRLHDLQRDLLGAGEISSLVEHGEQLEERIDHRLPPATGDRLRGSRRQAWDRDSMHRFWRAAGCTTSGISPDRYGKFSLLPGAAAASSVRRPVQGSTRPCRIASRAISAGLETPSLALIWVKWLLTVLLLRCRMRAQSASE
ncbi:MAG: hypothetical protein AW07_01591 [Candidatus Accumulibacter sp. SK-11]|nr:MAG: hypothetical protein AW07_01591 [Candidatus Accumulibacter sp. SK-11]